MSQEHPGGRKHCKCDECVERRREIGRRHYRRHRRKVQDKVREYKAQPHVKERQREADRERRATSEHREYTQEYVRREDVKARKRERRMQPEQKERERATKRRWVARNPGRVYGYNHDPARREHWSSPVGKGKRARYLIKVKAIPAPCSHMPWTPEDDDLAMCDNDCVVAHQHARTGIEKCYRLGRSYYAVMARRSWLRAQQTDKSTQTDHQRARQAIPTPCAGMPWSPKDDVIVMRDDISVIEICCLLGRSYGSVLMRRSRLRRKGWLHAA